MSRVVLIILDSLGIGGAPDAKFFNDAGANTLGNILLRCQKDFITGKRKNPLDIPNLGSLGIFKALQLSSGINFNTSKVTLEGGYAAAISSSADKDTPSGHWELVGKPINKAWHKFEKNSSVFPKNKIDKIIEKTKLAGILGDCHASGTEIICRLGAEHVKTGKPIFYTSSDSVVQIAAHEEHFGLKRLLDVSESAGKIFHPMGVCRIIARPFLGDITSGFYRTRNRKDFPCEPPFETLCDAIVEAGNSVWGIGKIGDIFNHRAISTVAEGVSDEKLFNILIKKMRTTKSGDLIFANFVEFDSLYGHRRDVSGYAAALERFDKWIPRLIACLGNKDLLVITADHGNDPTAKGNDHTRECVPVLMIGAGVKPKSYGVIKFSDVGKIISEHLNIDYRS